MFQSFDSTTRPEDGPVRLARLREEMTREGLAGFLVPRADAHQGEYVAPHDDRLAWLTGFTGSAGIACILMDRAGVFIDGRYRVQVKAQVDLAHFTPVPWPETKPGDWLKAALPQGGAVGIDPWLHTPKDLDALTEALDGTQVAIRETPNLVDRIWADQPAPPQGPIAPYPEDLAGETHADKRARIGRLLAEAGQSAAVLTLPDSIAWLLNVRGADIPRNPVPHAFAILHDDGRVTLYADPSKVTDALKAHLGPEITLRPAAAFGPGLRSLPGKVRVDPASAPLWVLRQLEDAGSEVALADDPCILPKARKTAAELAGARAAHARDAVAMIEFLAWIDAEAPGGGLTEIDVVRGLEEFRAATGKLRDISFETIAGAGPNGAIVHYRVTEATNRRVAPGDLLLVDSGAQYLDGTTDITRTLAIGPVPEDAKAPFTRVLKGMIAISRARFPRGLAGRDLDALARNALWQAGQDYDHGTGHGVGAYLCVHEGPQRIARISTVPLEPGMILSNEPGYYREGAFGIRIENLIAVEEAPALTGGDDRRMLSFETLTWVPIDRRLIAPEMLDAGERAWLNAYHAEVAHRAGPDLSDRARAWLVGATLPI
ncbi:X-Pro aminopeptidase [Rhodovulum sulfidophilum]|uniref:Aminopeptidase P family protein n=1 Tax=Rhodovulum visakhapatnamense TaxID=364297 RepID=A0ABS1RKT4_9RHOB|nr:aminopeptidase P family protein [Rhodovulum visakhapatnamense]MBL3568488.1 aminopeptidase P family protein [Rhodovulum visakhapatnamense]MBL3579492.1 aminopeptidase P family protein [Rhodovulum visakhapatnamense]OLS45638.1 X-Pro aminopeptidase [Rhodovulum sulfidophilum]